VTTGAKTTVALLGATWSGIILMLVGVVLTPAQWCDELPQPGGQTVLEVGFGIVLLAGIASTFAVTLATRIYLWIGWAVSAASVTGVLIFAHDSSGGWGTSCG